MSTYEKSPLQHPQVFLSFRGAELRQNFIAHLEMALKSEGVNVYVEGEQLSRGDPIDLFKGIEESRIALVIFSRRYSASPWCLEELVKIKERAEEGKLVVIPVFYKLNPSDVKEIEGDFGVNLWNLVKGTSKFDKLEKWKEALEFVSGYIGFVLDENSNESKFVHEIVKSVMRVASHLLSDAKSDVNPKEADSVQIPGKVRKDDDFLGEANSDPVNEENNQGKVSESSSMVCLPPPQHQVFISFRGAEVRRGFLSHLFVALKNEGVNVFIDRAEEMDENLVNIFNRINDSRIALVIFSRRYAESAWCLNELAKIKERMDKRKLLVIPVFYKVEPSEVKNQGGEFGDNFWNLVRASRGNQILIWKQALESVASMVGIYLKEDGSEIEVITLIVKEVLKIISQQEGENTSLFPSTEKGESTDLPSGKGEKDETYLNERNLFGMEQRMEQLEQKLEFDCYNVTRIIGVVGMPGIGKTTLAMRLHEKWNHKFIRSVPLLGIRKMSEDYGPAWLRKTLLELLLEGKYQGISDETVKVLLLKHKIFAVFDDVSDKEQLEFLLGDLDWIKQGSKIVITTCDKSLLDGFAHDIYVVPELNDRDAFQFFSSHAFNDQIFSPTDTFLTLSRMFVDYARGHPLALSLLGMELCGKDKSHWEYKLETLTKKPDIHDVLRVSIDELNERQKDVFLDIVFFFKSEDEYFVKSLLDSGDPDSTDAVSEVKELANRFLITISDSRVQMHDLLYTCGKVLGSPRWLRLWNYEDILAVLKTRKISDTNNVRGIFLDMSKLKESMCLDVSTFVNMRNLRYLKIYNSCCPRQCKTDYNLYFPDGLRFPLSEVRYLHWVKFPLEQLPPDFNPVNLVDLRLPYSEIECVWKGYKDTPGLKWVDLSHSRNLLDLSALSKAENLRRLNLEGCTSLDELPVEIQNMKSLVILNLRGCTSLWFLPKMNLISLKTLILSGCSNLKDFQLISESVEFLHLDGTAIKGLPPSTQNLQRLVVLNLKNCKMLKCLPNCLGKLEVLNELILSGCSRLKNLPDVRSSLKHIQILLLDGTGAKEMPSISCFNGSEGTSSADMSLQPIGSHCSVREWPCGVNGVSSLRRLCLSGSVFVSLQPDIGKLFNLKWLDVKHCKNLRSVPILPPRLQYFDAHSCDSLKRVANPLAFPVLSDQIHAAFNFSNCNKLDQDAKDNIISYTRRRSQLVLDEITRYSGGLVSEALIGTCFPGWEVPAWFSHRASGSVLNPKLHRHWSDNTFTGIALCAVILFHDYHEERKRLSVKCNCEFKNEDGSSVRFSCTVGGWSGSSNPPRKIESSHVFIGFTSGLDINKISEGDNEEKCVCTEISMEFEVTDGKEEIKSCQVVKCGFSFVYPPEERGNICSDLKTVTPMEG